MANPLTQLLGSPRVIITNSTLGFNVAMGARHVKAKVVFESELLRHAMESGKIVADARIVKPVRVEMDIIAPDRATYETLNSMRSDTNSVFALQVKGLFFDRMVIEDQILTQDKETLGDATPMRLTFKEIMVQGLEVASYTQPADGNILNRGIAALRDTVGGAVQTVTNKVSDIINGVRF